MGQEKQITNVPEPHRILSYFKLESWSLALVTVSGILYNVGMLAGPFFEGFLAQRLLDIMNGNQDFYSLVRLAEAYLLAILLVQLMRSIKRFYVRRFANNTNRNMRHMLYNSLVTMSINDLEKKDVGSFMTRAIADVDACVEGMRKFTTEVFDTGVVLIAYFSLLLYYDWRLTLISCIFTPLAYIIAKGLKSRITRYNVAFKNSTDRLNTATMDRISHALTYRIHGSEQSRDTAYEGHLEDYEKRAVLANIWENTMQPLYNIIAMSGAVLILFFGAKNVLGTGWTTWNIAAFTTFLSAFTKMALKSSKAAKLFNSVQMAQVSWARIKPLLKDYIEPDTRTSLDFSCPVNLAVSNVSLQWPDSVRILLDLNFSVEPGQVMGIAGAIASGKSTLGQALIGMIPYSGSIKVMDRELSGLSGYESSRLISYLGHEPELMADTLEENIRLGEDKDITPYLKAVSLDEEVAQMPLGAATLVGSGGIRLSGGQQARTALARTLYHPGQILVLDDPFSALDKTTEEEIFENLCAFTNNKIVILISHRLYLFPRLDKVLFLNNGTGTFSTHQALLDENGPYARMYLSQVEGSLGK